MRGGVLQPRGQGGHSGLPEPNLLPQIPGGGGAAIAVHRWSSLVVTSLCTEKPQCVSTHRVHLCNNIGPHLQAHLLPDLDGYEAYRDSTKSTARRGWHRLGGSACYECCALRSYRAVHMCTHTLMHMDTHTPLHTCAHGHSHRSARTLVHTGTHTHLGIALRPCVAHCQALLVYINRIQARICSASFVICQ